MTEVKKPPCIAMTFLIIFTYIDCNTIFKSFSDKNNDTNMIVKAVNHDDEMMKSKVNALEIKTRT